MSNRVLLSALRRDQCRARRTRSNDGAAQTERRLGAADAFFYIDGAPDRRWNARCGAQSAGRLWAGDWTRERQ